MSKNKEKNKNSLSTRIMCIILAAIMFGSVAVSIIYSLLGIHFH